MDLKWDILLEKVRSGTDPLEFQNILPQLLKADVLHDEIKLRLLGNLLANNEQNRRKFCESGLVDTILTRPSELMLQVILNAVIDSPETAQYVLSRPGLPAALRHGSKMSVVLMEALYEELEEIPLDIGRAIISEGLIQLILIDETFETAVLDKFEQIFRRAQSLDNDTGVKIVGNITFHPQFNLSHALGVVGCPFTCETGVMLANLTVKKVDIGPVLHYWPDAPSQALKLLNDVSYDPPLDRETLPLLEMVPFLRNISRDASVVAKWDPRSVTKIVKGITRSPLHAELGWDLAANFLAHFFDPQLLEYGLSTQPGPGMILLASNAIDSGAPPECYDLLTAKIKESLGASPDQVSPWVKGTRSLAILSKKGATVNIDDIKKGAPTNEHVQANLKAIGD